MRRRRLAPITGAVRGLTQNSAGLVPIPQIGGRCDLRRHAVGPIGRPLHSRSERRAGCASSSIRFILMTCAGLAVARPYHLFTGSDISSAATAAVDSFLGGADGSIEFYPGQRTNLTVAYSGIAHGLHLPPDDPALRQSRACVAGGVDLFLLGSELRGSKPSAARAGRKAGTTGGDGRATWDYPFVAGLAQLADDVRGVFDAAVADQRHGGLHNLISLFRRLVGLDGLSASGRKRSVAASRPALCATAISISSAFDNYLPLSDWTTGDGGLDAPTGSRRRRAAPGRRPRRLERPRPDRPADDLQSSHYLKANIEGGEKFNWFYNDGNNLGVGLDPDGTDLRVSLPAGRPAGAGAQRLCRRTSSCSPTSSCAGGGTIRIRRSTTPATAAAGRRRGRSPNGCRNRNRSSSPSTAFPACDRGDQPAERVLRSEVERKLHAVLVDLGSEREHGRRVTRRARDDLLATARAAGGLRILDHRRQQRDIVGRRADDRDRLHVGLELGRAAVPDLSGAAPMLGRRRQLAGGRLGSTARGRTCRSPAPAAPAGAGAVHAFPALPALGLVGENTRRAFRPGSAAACLRPRSARGQVWRCRCGRSS